MFGIITKGKANKAERLLCCCINPSRTCTLNTLCSSGPLKRIEKRWKRFRKSNRMSKGVTQLLYKEQCRRVGLEMGDTVKAMKSLMMQREWTGIECWLCLQDNEGPAHEAGRSQVPNKQKEGVCHAAGSGPAEEVLSKARWGCKELTCSLKCLEGSMPQANHSRFRKSSELKIVANCSNWLIRICLWPLLKAE